jgi:hypothetical protein
LPKGDEITTRGYRILTSVGCTTIMIAELAVISGMGSSLDYMGIGWDWFGESVRLCLCLRWTITFVFCWTTTFVFGGTI